MHPTRAYEMPEDPDAALALAAHHPPSAFLAGGTSERLRHPPFEWLLIDLSRLGLDTVDVGPSNFRLGATATLNRVLEHFAVRQLAEGILHEALEASGHAAWRNHATLGGRLMDWAVDDALTAVLVVLGARGVLQSLAGAAPETRALESLTDTQGGLLLRVEIETSAACRFALETLRLTTYDPPVVSVAAAIRVARGKVSEARIAAAGVGARLRRAQRTESALVGSVWPLESFESAQEALCADIQPQDDVRATARFRAHVAATLLGRALCRLAEPRSEDA